jgi:hypothetical protein
MFTCKTTGYCKAVKCLPCQTPGCGEQTYTPPYCRKHTHERLGVEIRDGATVEGKAAGFGLYARRPFPKGTLMVPIDGEFVGRRELVGRYGSKMVGPYIMDVEPRDLSFDQMISNPLVVALLRSVVYDGACERWIGHFANSHPHDGKCNAMIAIGSIAMGFGAKLHNFAMPVEEMTKYNWLMATRDIQIGEQILTTYHRDGVDDCMGCYTDWTDIVL